jgi:hypothetical protein
MQTSFHHQPEAQHPKSPAIQTPVGRLPHLWSASGQTNAVPRLFVKCQKPPSRTMAPFPLAGALPYQLCGFRRICCRACGRISQLVLSE